MRAKGPGPRVNGGQGGDSLASPGWKADGTPRFIFGSTNRGLRQQFRGCWLVRLGCFLQGLPERGKMMSDCFQGCHTEVYCNWPRQPKEAGGSSVVMQPKLSAWSEGWSGS